MFNSLTLAPYLLSLKTTLVASVIIFTLGLSFAIVLVKISFKGKILLSTLLTLPLVLPPSVVGFYLLILLGRGSWLRDILQIDLLFTWKAAVIASVVVALPLMVESARVSLLSVDRTLEDIARTLGYNEWEVFVLVTFPLAKSGILAGLVLSIARALGEFGATLIIAGNIPQRTQTLPLAIYDAVQNQNYGQANQMVMIITLWAFFMLGWARSLENQ